MSFLKASFNKQGGKWINLVETPRAIKRTTRITIDQYGEMSCGYAKLNPVSPPIQEATAKQNPVSPPTQEGTPL